MITMESKSFQQTRIVYILYIIGAFVWPIMVVGVILAYIEKGKASESFILTHLIKQIRIFWTCFFCVFLGGIVVATFMLIVFFNISMSQTAGGGLVSITIAALFLSLCSLALLAYVLVASIRGLSKLDANEVVF